MPGPLCIQGGFVYNKKLDRENKEHTGERTEMKKCMAVILAAGGRGDSYEIKTAQGVA